ncbi:HEAT repeat domain-containing protein [Actinoplanes sp. NPDC051861]|uniref:HEAT repeat domain-containing protein n=1 Tax=Actinoplanes sp. NPDC051861 TaxID=3155170 RepID=UPI0034172197
MIRKYAPAALAALLEELAAVDEAGAARAALAGLAADPGMLVRLDEYARGEWCPSRQVGARMTDEAPLTVALASTHRDGRVRERAVASMLAVPSEDLVPFLVLRTSDWARPVRDRARAGLALLLADRPGKYLGAMLPVTTEIERRMRGTFAVAQARAALSIASPETRRALVASPHPATRRFIWNLGLDWGWWSPDELIALSDSGPDPRIRTRAAEDACRDALWRRREGVLHRLAGSRLPEVRAVALTGLVRTGNDPEVVKHLDDPAPLVRALARDAARRTGVDALARYRTAVLTAPTPPAIAGFAETASAKESPLLEPLLRSSEAKVRIAAVRALRLLDAVTAATMIPLLGDPSSVVVREAANALRPMARTVSADLLWQLLADPGVARRRASYRLLTAFPVAAALRAGLIAATDSDPRLAMRAQADVTRVARSATHQAWRYGGPPDLVITAEEGSGLDALLCGAAPALSPDTVDSLTSWLDAAVS